MLANVALFGAMAFEDDLSGVWHLSYTMPDGMRHESTLDLKATGQNLTGKISSRRGTVEITSGTINGNSIVFTVVRRGNGDELHVQFSGTVEGGIMKLAMQYRDHEAVEMTATRGETSR
jgi:hypothetical protein